MSTTSRTRRNWKRNVSQQNQCFLAWNDLVCPVYEFSAGLVRWDHHFFYDSPPRRGDSEPSLGGRLRQPPDSRAVDKNIIIITPPDTCYWRRQSDVGYLDFDIEQPPLGTSRGKGTLTWYLVTGVKLLLYRLRAVCSCRTAERMLIEPRGGGSVTYRECSSNAPLNNERKPSHPGG